MRFLSKIYLKIENYKSFLSLIKFKATSIPIIDEKPHLKDWLKSPVNT